MHSVQLRIKIAPWHIYYSFASEVSLWSSLFFTCIRELIRGLSCSRIKFIRLSCSLLTAFHSCSSFVLLSMATFFSCSLELLGTVFVLSLSFSFPQSPYSLCGADCTSLINIPHNTLLCSLFPQYKITVNQSVCDTHYSYTDGCHSTGNRLSVLLKPS